MGSNLYLLDLVIPQKDYCAMPLQCGWKSSTVVGGLVFVTHLQKPDLTWSNLTHLFWGENSRTWQPTSSRNNWSCSMKPNLQACMQMNPQHGYFFLNASCFRPPECPEGNSGCKLDGLTQRFLLTQGPQIPAIKMDGLEDFGASSSFQRLNLPKSFRGEQLQQAFWFQCLITWPVAYEYSSFRENGPSFSHECSWMIRTKPPKIYYSEWICCQQSQG